MNKGHLMPEDIASVQSSLDKMNKEHLMPEDNDPCLQTWRNSSSIACLNSSVKKPYVCVCLYMCTYSTMKPSQLEEKI